MSYLDLTTRGWAVFPLIPGWKKPYRGTTGVLEAVSDPEAAKALFAPRSPKSNVGLATGKKSGIFVIDLDLDEAAGKDGPSRFEKLVEKHGPLPDTFMVWTPRGGVHLYFKYPKLPEGHVVNSDTDVLDKFIDVRGDGGYVVAPGSSVGGKDYAIGCDAEPADAPEWILKQVIKAKPPEKIRRFRSLYREDAAWVKSALKYLPADMGYGQWLEVGMALHDWDEYDGLAIWEEWSRTASGKFKEGECATKWSTFHEGGGIGLGTLAYYAKAKGWSPPVAEGIRGAIVETLLTKGLPQFKRDAAICDAVVKMLKENGKFFRHAEEPVFSSCMYFDSNLKRLVGTQSDSFTSWLSDMTRINLKDSLWGKVQSAVDTEAMTGADTEAVVPSQYWARKGEALYLSNGDGAMVRVTREGLDEVDNGTDGVLFAAGKTLTPWKLDAEPKDIFETASIFSNFQGGEPFAKDILKAWAYSLPTNPESKPILCASGEIGSGKTRVMKAVAEFYGLAPRIVHMDEKGLKDFWVGMDAGGIYVLDNVDTHIRRLADTLAEAATGGSDERRMLYKDRVVVQLKAKAWLAVTSANPTFASDAGLADRLQVVKMARVTSETADERLSQEILQHRDSGLVYLAWTLCRALREPVPEVVYNRRHPDYSSFALRIGRAMGQGPRFDLAIKSAEETKGAFCLTNDRILGPLLEMLANMTRGEFSGKLTELNDILQTNEGKDLEWLTPTKLGKKLTSARPHLEKVLAKFSHEKTRDGVKVTLRLRPQEGAAGAAVTL